jgi:hypothetical protein
MTWTKTITFNDRNYHSYSELARALAPLTGFCVRHLHRLISKYDGDGDAVLRRWQTHHCQPRQPRPKLAIQFDGRTLTRKALARELAPQLGLSVEAIDARLRKNGNDVERLRRELEQHRIVVDDTTYPDRAAFIRALHQRYHPKLNTVRRWVSQEGLEKALLHARTYARRWRERAQQRKDLELPIILFGWHFRSFSAMCRYYEIKANKAAWEDHVLANKSSCLFPPIATKLAQWWQAALLDERNRWDVAAEARIPKSRLPLNPVQMPITDPWEINMLKVQATGRHQLETMIETARRAERDPEYKYNG